MMPSHLMSGTAIALLPLLLILALSPSIRCLASRNPLEERLIHHRLVETDEAAGEEIGLAIPTNNGGQQRDASWQRKERKQEQLRQEFTQLQLRREQEMLLIEQQELHQHHRQQQQGHRSNDGEEHAMTFYVQGIMKTGTTPFGHVFNKNCTDRCGNMLTSHSFMSIPMLSMRPNEKPETDAMIHQLNDLGSGDEGVLVFKHFKYGLHTLINRSVTHPFVYTITLRDPVERLMSRYRYQAYGEKHYPEAFPTMQEPLSEFVMQRHVCNIGVAFIASNTVVWHDGPRALVSKSRYLDYHCPPFNGEGNDGRKGVGDPTFPRHENDHPDEFPPLTGYEALHLAKQRVDQHYSLILLVDRGAESLCLLHEMTFDGHGVCATTNATLPTGHPTVHRPLIVSANDARLLTERNELDYILFDFANRRMDVMLDILPQCKRKDWNEVLRNEDGCQQWMEQHVEARHFCLPFGRCGMTSEEIERIRTVEMDLTYRPSTIFARAQSALNITGNTWTYAVNTTAVGRE
eukprot:TRINITY_DN461_c0_g1_i4.p1 TRINITY_DN461_c0_g1~~TRINITY_DN461_c0_g1_i4.p1  ORF type:complete len:518 (+),score=101.56 TRINITY_DN461_c0_g1_i4:144-1697(+)